MAFRWPHLSDLTTIRYEEETMNQGDPDAVALVQR